MKVHWVQFTSKKNSRKNGHEMLTEFIVIGANTPEAAEAAATPALRVYSGYTLINTKVREEVDGGFARGRIIFTGGNQ